MSPVLPLDESNSDSGPLALQPQGSSFTLLLLLLPLMGFATFGSGLLGWRPVTLRSALNEIQPGAGAETEYFSTMISTVNPNCAPWWELTILPGIGESKAQEIEALREAWMADQTAPFPTIFRSAADFDQIRGIGPKTIKRISAELCFSDSQ